MSSQFKVSAVVSAYNSERFILGCLQDLIGQTLYQKGELEIVVVDSGSFQNEKAIVAKFQQLNPNVLYIRTDQRETLYSAWNRGFQAAHGRFFTNANTDDRHHPEAFEILSEELDQHADIDLVYARCKESHVANQPFADCPDDILYDYPEYDPPSSLLHYQFGPQPLWRASVHESIGWFDDSFQAVGDYDFNLRFALGGFKARLIARILGAFYLNPNSVTSNPGQQLEKQRLLAKYRTDKNVLRLCQIAGHPVDTNEQRAAALHNMGRQALSFPLPWSKKTDSAPKFAAECLRWALRCTPGNKEIVGDLRRIHSSPGSTRHLPLAVPKAGVLPKPRVPGVTPAARKRISVFAGDAGNFCFAKPIVSYLSEKGYEVQTHPPLKLTPENLASILDASDLAWFEWGNGPIITASNLPKTCPIVCRVHRYENYSQEIKRVKWSQVDRLIFVNPVFAAVFKELVDPQIEAKTRISIIPNPVMDSAAFSNRRNNFNIAYISRFQADKNPVLMLQILAALVTLDPRYRLFMIGRIQDLQLYQYCMKLIEDLRLQSNFFYQGQIENVESWLEDKSILLSTSIVESQGLGIMEAMMKGIKAVIHAGFGGLEDIYPSKLLFRTVDEAVRIIASQEYNSQEYRQWVLDRYGSQIVLPQIGKLVDEMINPAPVKPPGTCLHVSPDAALAALSVTANKDFSETGSQKAAISPVLPDVILPSEAPLVSVCIPTFNRAHYITDAIASALNQTYSGAYEVVVVDDGSSDATADTMGRVTSPRLRYVRKEHSGGPSTRNRAVAEARGEFILWLDSDDVLLPNTLSHHISIFQQHPDHDVFYGDVIVVDEALQPIRTATCPEWHGKQAVMPAHILGGNCVHNPGAMVRKSCYERFGLYDETFTRAHDYEWWSRLAGKASFKHVGTVVAKYRWHSSQLSSPSPEKPETHRFEARVVHLMMQRHSLQELYPNIDWKHLPLEQAKALAYLITAHHLLRWKDITGALEYAQKSYQHHPLEQSCKLLTDLRSMAKETDGHKQSQHSPEASATINNDFLRGMQHCERGCWAEGLDCFERQIELEPRKQGLHFQKACCLKQLGRAEDAKLALRTELVIQPRYPDALKLLTDLENETALATSPPKDLQPSASVLYEEGNLHMKQGHWAEALAIFDKLLQIEKLFPGAHYAKAICLDQLGQIGESEEAVRRELEFTPSNLDARRLFHALRKKRKSGPHLAQKNVVPDSCLHSSYMAGDSKSVRLSQFKPGASTSAGEDTSVPTGNDFWRLFDQEAIRSYYQPPAGNMEKYIQIQPVALQSPTISPYLALKSYSIRDFGMGLPAAESILEHILRNKMGKAWQRDEGIWLRTIIVQVKCELRNRATSNTFDQVPPNSVEDIDPEFARTEGSQRIADIKAYATRLKRGENLGPALYVTGAVLNRLGANTDPHALFMMDGARRLTATALTGQSSVVVCVLVSEDEYSAMLRPAVVDRLRDQIKALGWFPNYQVIPLVGVQGQRTLQRFDLMDLSLLRDQVVLDFGSNLGQSALKAALAGAKQVVGIEGMQDTYKLAVEIANLSGLQNVRYLNVDFNHPKFDQTINATMPNQVDYSFFFSVYRTKELNQRDRLFQFIIDKTHKGIFFEGHAHPRIDTLEYYDWLFESFGLTYHFLGNSEGTLRPLFFLDLSSSKKLHEGKSIVVNSRKPEKLPTPEPASVTPRSYVNIGMVTFNRIEFTCQSIEALIKNTQFPYVLTVVDNNSTDGTRVYLRELKEKGIIKNLFLMSENMGVTKARNIAWQLEPAAHYYLNLDNDIVIQKANWLEPMVEAVEKIPQLGAVGYNFEQASYPLSEINGCRIRIKKEGNLGGACYFIPKRTEQLLGYWCEDYGLYGEEDSDHRIRLNLAGLLNAYMEDESVGIHLPGGRASKIDPLTLIADDPEELKLHRDYRIWKDNRRREMQARGGPLHRNWVAYKQGTRSLYVPRGVFLGLAEDNVQVFDQDEAYIFLPVSGEFPSLIQRKIMAWASTHLQCKGEGRLIQQNGRSLLRIGKKLERRGPSLTFAEKRCSQGLRQMQKGNWTGALASFDATAKHEPNRMGLNLDRAVCLLQLNRFQEAEQAVQLELKINPGDSEASALLTKLKSRPGGTSSPEAVPPSSDEKLSGLSPHSNAKGSAHCPDETASHQEHRSRVVRNDDSVDWPIESSIIIPIHNQWEFTRNCLNSLFASTPCGAKYEVIVVDDASTDGSAEKLEDLSLKYPNLRVLSFPQNQGFAKACNLGAEAATGKILVFLNNDTEPLPNWLEAPIQRLAQDTSIGIVGSKLLYPDRSIQHCGIEFCRTVNPEFPIWPHHRHLRTTEDDVAANSAEEVQAVTGACLFIPNALFQEVGGFPTEYRMYFEDIDLCLKVRQRGLRIFYEPRSVVIHYESKSSFSREIVDSLNIESARIFFAKWGSQFPTLGLPPCDPSCSSSRVPILHAIYANPELAKLCERMYRYLKAGKTAMAQGIFRKEFSLYPGADVFYSKLAASASRWIPNCQLPAPLAGTMEDDGGNNGKRRPSVVWCAPLLNPSGYCSEALSFAVAIRDLVDLELFNVGTVQSSVFVDGLPENTKEVLQSKLQPQANIIGRVAIQHVPGISLMRLPQASINIGRTMFETDRIPSSWVLPCNEMDEIWVPSRFNLETFARSGVAMGKLKVIPELVDESEFDPDRHQPLWLPNRKKFNFLSIFELTTRKGWDVLLSAYFHEFHADDDVCLYLRTYLINQPGQNPAEFVWQKIREHVSKLGLGNKRLPQVEVLAKQIPTRDLPKLYKSVDCLVAPSRGEGWGRPQHEAMMMGMPVIATNWSGNTEFMNKDNAYLLDYDLTVAKDLEPELRHYEGHVWANPSDLHLRFLMRHVQQNPNEGQTRGKVARSFVLDHFSTKPVIAQVLRRLQEIDQNGRFGIMDVSLESAKSSLSNLPATISRVNRYIAEGRIDLASRIVEKELGLLPESVEILSRIKNVHTHDMHST